MTGVSIMEVHGIMKNGNAKSRLGNKDVYNKSITNKRFARATMTPRREDGRPRIPSSLTAAIRIFMGMSCRIR